MCENSSTFFRILSTNFVNFGHDENESMKLTSSKSPSLACFPFLSVLVKWTLISFQLNQAFPFGITKLTQFGSFGFGHFRKMYLLLRLDLGEEKNCDQKLTFFVDPMIVLG